MSGRKNWSGCGRGTSESDFFTAEDAVDAEDDNGIEN